MSEKKSVSTARTDFAASVIKAAWRLFVENGYVGTSMDDVAAAVGVSKPTVYEAYKNKQTLFEAVIDETTRDFDPSATQAIADYEGPMIDLFRGIPNAAKVFVRQQRRTDLVRLLISEGPRRPFLVTTYRKALWERELTAWATLLGRAMDRGEFRRMDPMVAARICSAPAVNIMIERIVYGDHAVDDEIVDTFLDEAYGTIARSCLTMPGSSRASPGTLRQSASSRAARLLNRGLSAQPCSAYRFGLSVNVLRCAPGKPSGLRADRRPRSLRETVNRLQ